MFLYRPLKALPKLKPIRVPKPDPNTENCAEYNTFENVVTFGRCAKSGVRFKVLRDGIEVDPDTEFPEVSVYACSRPGVFGYVFKNATGSDWRWVIMRNVRTSLWGSSTRMQVASGDMNLHGNLHFGTGQFTHSSDVDIRAVPTNVREQLNKIRYHFEITG